MRTIFCVYNDLCDSSMWLVDLCGFVGINQSQTRIVKDIINSENCYVIHLLNIIDIQKWFLHKFNDISMVYSPYKYTPSPNTNTYRP